MATLYALADLKSILEIEDTSKDSLLTLIGGMVQSRIESFLARTLTSATFTETVYEKGSMMPLKGLPVSSVTSVRIQHTQDSYTDLTSSQWDVTPYGIRLNQHTVTQSDLYVSVVYAGGYSATGGVLTFNDADRSTNIKRAALYQMVHEWKKKDKPGATLIETQAGSMGTEKAIELLQEVKDSLAPCVHPYWCLLL